MRFLQEPALKIWSSYRYYAWGAGTGAGQRSTEGGDEGARNRIVRGGWFQSCMGPWYALAENRGEWGSLARDEPGVN